MPNTINYAQKFLPQIVEIYKAGSASAILDSQKGPDMSGVNEVKILKVSTSGLGTYDRTNGYPKGAVTAEWVTFMLEQERAKQLGVDRMDDEETLGMVFGQVVGQFMKMHVIPENDSYRFAKYATGAGTKATATLTKDDVIEAIDTGSAALDAAEAPEGRILFINSALKPVINQALNRQWGSDSGVNTTLTTYNGMNIVYVPEKRFNTQVTLHDGSSNFGFTPAGKAINFMIVEPSAVAQAVKLSLPKIFDPDTNQDKDEWKFQFREYHDAKVWEEKASGIYVCSKA